MREQPEYDRALFVFNDNESQFEAFESGRPSGFTPGGGNAAIRPWRGENPPRAAGIPTGDRGGYPQLDERVLGVIGRALDVVADLVDGGWYDTVVFSGDQRTERLGASIFSPHPDVLHYVYRMLIGIAPGSPRAWTS
jgi:hypothetical protein